MTDTAPAIRNRAGAPELRVLGPADVTHVTRMREQVLGWEPRPDYVTRAIEHGHAVGAFAAGAMVGFRYQHALAPDVLGDGLILVELAWSGVGVGRRIVAHFEATVPPAFAMSVVLNTDLIVASGPKPDATGFWIRCGYELLASTGPSRLLVRHLRP